MATIKEMAAEATKAIREDPIGSYPRGYSDGANTVLEEIDKLISLWPEHPMKRTIKNKIKELKGEK